MRETRGFLLQIRPGVVSEKSAMQLAKEKQSGWLQVPRIAIHALPITNVRGGNFEAEKEVEDAIAAAKAQWTNGIRPEVQIVGTVYEVLEGKELSLDEMGQIQGLARCIYGNGDIYEGEFLHGMKHGRGTYKFATQLANSLLPSRQTR